jgi:hypothetical protein
LGSFFAQKKLTRHLARRIRTCGGPTPPTFYFPNGEITGRFTGQTEYFGLKIRTKLHFVRCLLGFLAFFDRLKITGRDFRKTGKQRPKTGKFFAARAENSRTLYMFCTAWLSA